MIAWINFGILVFSALAMLYFYVRSVGPAALEKRIGEAAYARCTRYRVVAGVFEIIALANYIVYYFYPLPIGLPRTFPWAWWISIVVGVAIAVPGGYLWWRGTKDAGEETVITKKGHMLYGGVYERMRHPQAAGEITYWWVAAFILNSPFLALVSFIWVPIFWLMCWAEEKDLAVRYGEPYLEYKRTTGFMMPRRKPR